MNFLILFKKLDKYLGTPLCYLLGLFVKDKHIPDPTKVKNILIVKLIAMGDIIVLLPTIHAIRKRYPNSKICFLTTPGMKILLQDSPDIDDVITFQPSIGEIFKTINRLGQIGFDLAIELTHYYRIVSLITLLSKIPHRVGFDISGQGRNTMLTKKVKYHDDLHEVDNFLNIAKAVDANLEEKKLIPPTFSTEKQDQEYISKILKDNNINSYIVIHPGTSATAKSRRWPADRFYKLAKKLKQEGYDIVFSGAQEEQPIIKKILDNGELDCLNLVGKTTLSQLLELFKQANLVISLDTGPMHLAAASGTPTLGLFGANTPVKWGPYGKQHQAIYHGPKVPCTQQQYGKVCNHPEGYHMKDITVNEVFEAVYKLKRTNKV